MRKVRTIASLIKMYDKKKKASTIKKKLTTNDVINRMEASKKVFDRMIAEVYASIMESGEIKNAPAPTRAQGICARGQ